MVITKGSSQKVGVQLHTLHTQFRWPCTCTIMIIRLDKIIFCYIDNEEHIWTNFIISNLLFLTRPIPNFETWKWVNFALGLNEFYLNLERGLTPSGASRPAGEPKVLHLSFLIYNFWIRQFFCIYVGSPAGPEPPDCVRPLSWYKSKIRILISWNY